jgi:DNA-binding MarR family transcriptional regulator
LKKKQITKVKARGGAKAVAKQDDFCKFENPKVHPELKSYFAYCLTKAAIRLRTSMDERLKPYNMISPQLGLLRLIEVNGFISQGELGQTIGIDKATMVKLIDNLEEGQYLVRKGCEKDRRIKYLSLTAAGTKMLLKGNKLRLEVERDFLSPLTAEERSVLEKALPKLVR